MKKLMIWVVCAMVTLTVGAQTPMLEDIQQEWEMKIIKDVPNGTLAAMLERFDETWPTYTVGDALSVIETGVAEKVLDENTGYRVINDAKNGYVEVTNDGSDEEYMSACVWRRQDGHRLLAVVLGKPTDPQIEFVCFYDYDPEQRTLTPDTFVAETITKGAVASERTRYYELPRKGKDILVWEDESRSEYRWNGWDFVLVSFPVAFSGSAPTISDLTQAYLNYCIDDKAEVEVDEGGVAFKHLWTDFQRGIPLPENATMTVDEKNGFVSCEQWQDEYLSRWEACYWNEADGQHKLFAFTLWTFENGRYIAGQYDRIEFYRYDTATKTMQWCEDKSAILTYATDDGGMLTYSLPRTGKDIVATAWYDDGRQKQQTLKWNGHGFTANDYSEEEPLDISVIPSTAERMDGFFQYAVYVNEESSSADESDTPAVYSVWLADERTGTAQKVCTTNPKAEVQWERMKGMDPDAVDVPITQIASAERAWIAPGDVGKVIVEGCPDGRNYWTYIIDVDAQTAKQFPSTEGVQDRDWNDKTVTLASYSYDDDGRYSFRRIYSTDGKFIRRTGGIERYNE